MCVTPTAAVLILIHLLTVGLFFFFQAKLGSVRSLEEIAMDLTEHSGAKINRLGEACLKNNLITASNGSLVSTGVDPNYFCAVISQLPEVNMEEG